jgi:hypothetical protein
MAPLHQLADKYLPPSCALPAGSAWILTTAVDRSGQSYRPVGLEERQARPLGKHEAAARLNSRVRNSTPKMEASLALGASVNAGFHPITPSGRAVRGKRWHLCCRRPCVPAGRWKELWRHAASTAAASDDMHRNGYELSSELGPSPCWAVLATSRRIRGGHP